MSLLTTTSATGLAADSPVLEDTRSRAISFGIVWSWLPTFACALGAVLGLIASRESVAMNTWPWLVGLVVFGMAHGAVDWIANDRERRRRGQQGGLRGFGWYLAWMGASTAAFLVAPASTCVAFFVLTAVHFGAADLHELAGPASGRSRRATWWWLTAVARGSLVLAVPFAVDPTAAWAPFATLTGDDLAPAAIGPIVVLGLVVATVGCVVIAVNAVVDPLGIGPRRCRRMVAETAAAIALLLFAPPLLAVGVYFLFVHAFKHTIRLARHDELLGPSAGTTMLRRVALVHAKSLPLGVAALVLIVPWAWWLGGVTAWTMTAASIGFYVISTLPHHALGLRLGRP